MRMGLAAALVVAILLGGGCDDKPSPERPADRGPKEIAITLDDAPVMRYYSHPSAWHRMLVVDSLMNAVQRYDAPLTVFAVGNTVNEPEGRQLLEAYLQRGAKLGNHSMSHPNFATISEAQARAEIEEAQALLEPIGQQYGEAVRYFRFPQLSEGATVAQRDQYLRVLKAEALSNARVTISTDDWRYDAEYTELELAEDWEARYEVGQRYMQHIREAIALWERTADELTGRNIRHVMLLHANRINRDYLGQILAELQAGGYTFITLERAYQDPIYQEEPSWTSPNGTSFLEYLKQSQR
ncbi:MAG: polysaccharide deacetylase family protein [Bacteroidota bacterium]